MHERTGRGQFFDQLDLAPHLRALFGNPSVSLMELTSSSIASGGSKDYAPLTNDELRRFLVDTSLSDIRDSDFLTPQACCWPMGSSWASYIARCVMVGALKIVGAGESQFLCASSPLPCLNKPAFSVATDDIITFESVCPGRRVPGTVCTVIAKLEAQWSKMNQVKKA